MESVTHNGTNHVETIRYFNYLPLHYSIACNVYYVKLGNLMRLSLVLDNLCDLNADSLNAALNGTNADRSRQTAMSYLAYFFSAKTPVPR